MTELAIAAGLTLLVTASYALGFKHGWGLSLRAWQRHEIAHHRGWPPLPRPLPPPPDPPAPKSQTSLEMFRAAHPTGRVPHVPLE